MRKKTETGMTEYPVSAEDIAAALASNVTFNTGILNPNTICVLSEGARRTVVEYRPPQKTALWLEGLDDPLRVPLPGLIMIRATTAGRDPDYRVYAVAERPSSFDAPLYHAPLPNIYSDGRVCWGTVAKPTPEHLIGNDLAEDWAQLLGTHFGSHSVHGKCRSHEHDIRRLYLDLEKRRARVYPKKELVPAKRTLGSVLEAAS
jgi:PRTRC genetic system protein B